MNTTADLLTHATGCPADRIELTIHQAESITTVHCLDCGAHHPPAPAHVGPLAGQGAWHDGVHMERDPQTYTRANDWPGHFNEEGDLA